MLMFQPVAKWKFFVGQWCHPFSSEGIVDWPQADALPCWRCWKDAHQKGCTGRTVNLF